MNTYYTFNEPLALKPTWADRLADWYWAARANVVARKPVTVKLACYCIAAVCVSALAGMCF